MSQESVLEIDDLTVKYTTYRHEITALNRIKLNIQKSQIVSIVGESGSGKSTLGLTIIGLLQKPPAKVHSGRIIFQGTDLLSLKEQQLTRFRGTGISMIFQEPLGSLDPVYTVGEQIVEAIKVRDQRHGKGLEGGPYPELKSEDYGSGGSLSKVFLPSISLSSRYRKRKEYSTEILQTLKKVQIPDPENVVDKYPHELSGGMCQRIVIARALIEKPALLIADEPTSALDVTNQALVLNLMRTLRDEQGSSILFITHDLAVAAQIADTMVVMYAGEIIETGNIIDVFTEPSHPYTEGLIRSFPQRSKKKSELEAIAGDVPDMRSPPSGCRFHPRCKYAFSRCSNEHPELSEFKNDRQVACFLRN